MDFAFSLLPPEINSALMYTGSGSGSLMAASSAWDGLATELASTASSYQAVIDGLTSGTWTGPSSVSMAAAAQPYVAWLTDSAVMAEQAANAARMSASAYEAAHAATVHPAAVAANRSLLATLVATNFFGQNFPAIASTEAEYLVYWALDVAAMTGYAAATQAATSQLRPPSQPQQNSDGGTKARAAAADATANSTASDVQSQVSSAMTQLGGQSAQLSSSATQSTNPFLESLGDALTNWNNVFSTLTGPLSPVGLSSVPGGPFLSFGQVWSYVLNGQGISSYWAGPSAISGALAPVKPDLAPVAAGLRSASLGGAPVSGAMSRAALVGQLSVPQSWAGNVPAIRTLATALSGTDAAAAPAAPEAALAGEARVFGQMAMSSLAGRGVGATATRSAVAAASPLGGVLAEADPAAATILIIPALEE